MPCWGKYYFSPLVLLLLLAMSSVVNGDIELDLPIDCQPGKQCWVMHYVDLDQGPGALDMQCKKLSYDGHKGTDFAIRDFVAMAEGVEVNAAAAGVVKSTRDGMDDRALTIKNRHHINGKECGNGVIIEHKNGWTTQYCHMKRDSLQVRSGDTVEAGQALGLVGLSGETEFPHLHFAIRHQGEVIDPFTGSKVTAGCRADGKNLWKESLLDELSYRPFVAYNLGFADSVVNAEQVRSGKYRDLNLSPRAAAMVFWVDTIGIYPGDKMTLRIIGPDDEVLVHHTETFDRFNIRRFQFVGKKRKSVVWHPGIYRGEIRLLRESNDSQEKYVATKEILIK